ncbi:Males-absent on the first protein [Hanseniaspora opuntiae]|uniref:histone acetyltransferase n=1 Tax=Hanseniaspora opuntiae TaxID=211096 RepID=A0A1E5RRS4_9ASCO|nr:Males-absent on the first protein [Hanseniaspora opuntiae]
MKGKKKGNEESQSYIVTLKYNTSLQRYLHPSINEMNLTNLGKFANSTAISDLKKEPVKRRSLRNSEEALTNNKHIVLDMKLKKEVESWKQDKTIKKKLRKLDLEPSAEETGFFAFLDEYRNTHMETVRSQRKLYISGTEYDNMDLSGYVCGFCFKCFLDEFEYTYHVQQSESCESMTSQEDTVYDDHKGIMIKQLDGLTNSHALQRLSSLSKLFIPHKLNNASDIIKFDFFLLYINNEFAGYFSKEKNTDHWNLSCILIVKKSGISFRNIKNFQFGQFLIHFSYQLSILDEHSLGSPEKPFSDFGLLAYRKYFKFRLTKCISEEIQLDTENFNVVEIPMDQISKITGMIKSDIIFGFESMGVFQYCKTIQKIRVDFDTVRTIHDSEEYKHWLESINQFDKKHFKDFLKQRFSTEENDLHAKRISREPWHDSTKNNTDIWIDVDRTTKITLYKTLSEKDHEKYLNGFE